MHAGTCGHCSSHLHRSPAGEKPAWSVDITRTVGCIASVEYIYRPRQVEIHIQMFIFMISGNTKKYTFRVLSLDSILCWTPVVES